MFLRKSMPTFTENYSAAVERFEKYFSDFRKKNMVYKTCIPADFILMRHWRSIGHGGAGILW